MRAWPLLLLLAALVVLTWVLLPDSEQAQLETPDTQVETSADPRTAEFTDGLEDALAQAGDSSPSTESATPESEEREALHAGLDVQGTVLGGYSEALYARLVYVNQGEMQTEDWFHHPGLTWTKPRALPADGSFQFRGGFTDAFANYDWRVEVGIQVRDGDEFRGPSPLLTLGVSESFHIDEGVPLEIAPVAISEPIELVVPLHNWHLIPSEDIMLSGEFEKRPAMWHGKPTAWFKSSDGARVTETIRLSTWHVGRKFRVHARSDDASLDEPAFGEWIILQAGRHELAALQPIAGGMLEIFFPASRGLFPEKEGGAGFTNQTEIRLARFDAKRRTSFEARYMVDPGASENLYDPSWGLAPDPGGAWLGDAYVARVGWIEAGSWDLAVEVPQLGRIAEPVEIEIAPFDVTRVTMRWLDPGQKIRILPTPAGVGRDDYVLSTWVTLPTGKAHVYRFGLVEQSPRELQVPPGSRFVSSVSHWHGEPKTVGGPSSRLSFYRGEMASLRKPNAEQVEEDPQALPELSIRRTATSLVLEFPLDTSIKGYHMGEIRGLSGQLDEHAITFTVHPGRAIELIGFPPGYYDVRLAPNQPLISATEFVPWRTIQILAPTKTDEPPDSKSSIESGE